MTISQMGAILHSLSLHYSRQLLSVAENEAVLQSWYKLCGYIPPDVFADMCEQWLASSEKFFPSPGQLLPLKPRHIQTEDFWRRRLDLHFGNLDDPVPWPDWLGPAPDQPGCLAPPHLLRRLTSD